MRIRTIKPEMCQDEDLAELSPWAQLAAVRLLNHADDEGYFRAHPALVRAACFPLVTDESLSIHGILTELSNAKYIYLHQGVDGKQYGQIVSFSQHQPINRPKPSKIKPKIQYVTRSSLNHHGAVSDESSPEQGTGNREQGRETPIGASASGRTDTDNPPPTRTKPNGAKPPAAPDKPRPQTQTRGRQKPTGDEDFDAAWARRPPRAGSDPKQSALKAWRARRREGYQAGEMLAGIDRYRAWCEAAGKQHTEFTMRLATFLGTDLHFLESWDQPASKSQQVASRNAAAAQRASERFHKRRRALADGDQRKPADSQEPPDA